MAKNSISRRTFILSMLGAGVAISFGSVLYTDRDLVTRHQSKLFDPHQETALRAFIPIILDGVISKKAETRQAQVDRIVLQMELALQYLPSFSRDQFLDLLSHLSRRLTRWALAGQWTQLSELSVAQRIEILQSWRHSFISLLQQAYQGLRELVLASWYGSSEHWAPLKYNKPAWVVPGR
ncbi:hypothetical protein ACFSJ3_11655 [Corallincola platygyrae]|uniref:Twin-arginine translocation pathway signal protein n=1 Tax=Corallincola platygyrae TaxID=1193278 RepID=A0ABW4XQ76_9GAMM